MKFIAVVLFAAGAPLFAQTLTYGVVGGVPVTDGVRWSGDQSHRVTVGPSLELNLPGGFSLEASALYRRVGDTVYTSDGTDYTTRRRSGNSWEFPILAKYHFRHDQDLQPFLSTGVAFRKIWWNALGSTPSFSTSLESGAVVGAGVRYKMARFSIAPEWRYTRWNTSSANSVNEAALLVGVHF